MRLLTILMVVALPTLALAKPKVAVAPIDGDKDNAVAKVVAEAASDSAAVTSPSKTGKQIDALGIDTTDKKAVKKLKTKMGVDVVVVGKIEKSGGKKHLTLTLTGKKRGMVELDYKSPTSKSFKKELTAQLAEQIPSAAGKDDEDDEDEALAKRQKKEDEERARKQKEKDDEEQQAKRNKKKHDDDVAEETSKKHKRVATTDDDGEPKHGKKKHRRDTDGGELRDGGEVDDSSVHPLTQEQIWIDVGAAGIRRTLTYSQGGTGNPPPAVGTGAGALQLEGEAYLSKKGSGFGAALYVRQTVGLGIAPPGGSAVPITEAEYRVGARYRVVSGTSSYAFGLDYWRRREIADRSGLMSPTALDMPDADYLAVAPSASAHFMVGSKSALFANVELPYVVATGPMGNTFPAKGGIGFGIDAGFDYALATRYALRFEATFDQVGAALGANGRGVNGLTDRAMGVAATLAMTY